MKNNSGDIPHDIFGEIYDRHAAMMYGSILGIVQEEKSAEAILTNAFREINSLLHNGPVSGEPLWFLRCARRNAFSFLQHKGLNQLYGDAVAAGINELKVV